MTATEQQHHLTEGEYAHLRQVLSAVAHTNNDLQQQVFDLKQRVERAESILATSDLSLSSLKSLRYEDYLKTEHWQRIRKQALRRAEYRCQLCNAADTELHVHHRTYERLGEEEDADLTVLCQSCHHRFHYSGDSEEHSAP